MYLGLVWDTSKIHAKCQDTCILLECNSACKIRLGYIRIHQDTCILQDTRKIHQDTYPIGNVPKKDRKCARSPSYQDKSNCLAPLFARSLDCTAGIHMKLEPEVKILDRKLEIVASHRNNKLTQTVR